MRYLLLSLTLTSAPVVAALPDSPISLSLPVRCDIGRTCWIQKYADLSSGPERRDYRCGTLTTDEHDGVDFRLSSFAQMRAGVAVLAAAPGVVLRTRDGEPDAVSGAVNRKEAGNGVVIGHGNGWETQYSHLMTGSIRVRPGDRVIAGMPVGAVGLSGNTEYPHLHFSVRHGQIKIDPFTGLALPGRCNSSAGRPLWNATTLSAVGYQSGQIVRIAFAGVPQNRATLQRGDPRPPGRNDPMLLMAELIGVEAADVLHFELKGPDGRVLLTQDMTLKLPNLSWVGYSGTKPPAAGWSPGRYIGSVALLRAGNPDRRARVAFDMP